jgi:hypothetical protein
MPEEEARLREPPPAEVVRRIGRMLKVVCSRCPVPPGFSLTLFAVRGRLNAADVVSSGGEVVPRWVWGALVAECLALLVWAWSK